MRVFVSLFSLTSLLLGCSNSILGTRGGLRLTVTVPRPVISTGDSTTAAITLQNVTSHPITVITGGCLMLPYISTQATGEVVYPSGGNWYCVAIVRSLSLSPGATTTQQLVVYGADLTRPSGPTLARGEYSIYATLESSQFPLRSAPVALIVQ
jgi:hypothetical protein